jgi:C1A family cysteine protease
MIWRFNYRLIFVWIFSFVFLFTASVSGESREILRFDDGDTLEQLRQKIQHNGYGFQVGHNWVYDMPSEMKKKFFSRRPPPQLSTSLAPVDMGPLAEKLSQAALPAQFDWRNYNGHSYIGPVRDQGNCGSCYAFGACAAAEGSYNFANGRYDSNCVDFSESYIIWCLATKVEYNDHFFGCDGADYDYYELQALTLEGVTDESDFPYRESDPGVCTHWGDATVVFDSWHRIGCNDIDAIKTAIMTYGVVDAAVDVTSAFQAYSGGIYEDSRKSCPSSPCYYTNTNHAIALVGWNDNGDAVNKGYWILRNSWGSDWGENGYMRIKYKSARVACEAAYLVADSACSVPNVPGSITYPSTDSDGSFTVSWSTVSGAASYTLERATDGSFTSGRVTLYTGSSTSYAQTVLASGAYYYRIQANNSCGSSSWRTGGLITVEGGAFYLIPSLNGGGAVIFLE